MVERMRGSAESNIESQTSLTAGLPSRRIKPVMRKGQRLMVTLSLENNVLAFSSTNPRTFSMLTLDIKSTRRKLSLSLSL